MKKSKIGIAALVLLTCLVAPATCMGRYLLSSEGMDVMMIRRDPKNPMVHEMYGYDLMAEGKSVEAEREYRTALALSSSSRSARFLLGKALAAQGRYAEARNEWRIARVGASPSLYRDIRDELDSLPLLTPEP